ncbi:ABC transporter [candidate division LCP-89 bacterium B3_LCP]|uniref:ABC transporter n=1 Tax=candidate division LCP-89 bacterium B3_LCP TaxID=2012998 RepID=A0A532UU85_UNCL8|nr:MAG: ABC transporter [candidate division LCP-89 bacterium B3_LCP]
MIKLENLTKDFIRLRALDGLDLHVKKGEIFGFLGPNGAGKTTTIRLITGLLQPTFGRVIIGGIDMAERPRHAKHQIGYVPDHPFLYDRLSGREFIEFQAQLFLLKPDNFKPKLDELTDTLSMDEWLDERIESYSRGMRQKIVMVSALIHDPQLIVLDEPLVGLDPKAAKNVKDILLRRSESGTTIFFSTHTLSLAQEFCHNMAIINHGRLIAQGTYSELIEKQDPDLETAFLRLTEEPSEAEIQDGD